MTSSFKQTLTASLTLVSLFAVSTAASAEIDQFTVSGNGITATGLLYLGPTSTPGVLQVTGIYGTFADVNFGISGAITGFEPVGPPSSPPPFPAPGFTAAGFSYDNLVYPGGSPGVCIDYPFFGGVFDVYGVAFDVAGGYSVDLWSNGVLPGTTEPLYGIGDALGTTKLDDPGDFGLAVNVTTASVPAPAALFTFGVGALRLAARKRRKSATSS